MWLGLHIFCFINMDYEELEERISKLEEKTKGVFKWLDLFWIIVFGAVFSILGGIFKF